MTNAIPTRFSLQKFQRFAAVIIAGAISSLSATAQIVFNEVDSDQSGGDTMEFLELYDGGVGNTSLANHVLVFYNGSGNVAYRAIDLDGMSTDADGFFLVANVAVPGISERVSANTGVVIPSNGLQNSEEGLALYSGLDGDYFTTSSSGGQVPTKPGDVDLTNGAAIVDALVYQSSDSSSMLVEELGITGGGAVNEGADDTKDTASVGRVPDGGTAFDQSADAWSVLDPPTPGFANEPSGEL
ncbi:MAG: hypothetical protein ACI9NC_002274, partial [Verrucomicrobiales bacterium]